MPPRDIVLTAYACSAQAPCSQWAREMFAEEPIVLAVPGSVGTFLKKGRQWSATGDAFRAALRELAPQHKDVEIRRRALVTFSAGWQLTHNLLLSAKEQVMLDSCIVMDGLHSEEIDHWVNFAARAANRQAWMVLAHGQVMTPYVSSKIANERVFRFAVERNIVKGNSLMVHEALPSYLTDPEMPEDGVRITVSCVKDATGRVILPAETKVWEKDCLVDWDNCGELYRLEYAGDDRPDPVYIAWQAQSRFWRMLAERWNSAQT